MKRFAIEGGAVTCGMKRYAVDARGENLRAQFQFEPRGPKYGGTISLAKLVAGVWKDPIAASASLGLERNRLTIESARIESGTAHVEASGTVENFVSPRTSLRFRGAADAALLRQPALREGRLEAEGDFKFSSAAEWSASAAVSARGVRVVAGRVALAGVRGSARVEATPREARASGIEVFALGGRFTGKARVDEARRYAIEGNIEGIALDRVVALAGRAPPPWNGMASGSVRAEGRGDGPVTAEARIDISPGDETRPLQGFVDARLEGRKVSLRQSHLVTRSSRVDFDGVPGGAMRVKVESRDLDDFLPALPAESLPVRLDRGAARFEGVVEGDLETARVRGRVEASGVVIEGRRIDEASGEIDATRDGLRARRGTVAMGKVRAEIDGSAALREWKLERGSAVEATVQLRGEAAELSGRPEVSGEVTASARITGTVGDPRFEAEIEVARGAVRGQSFDRARARVSHDGKKFDLHDVAIEAGAARITGSGAFAHPPGDLG
ncbi:MAG: hypothetical protein ACRD96_08940, partial [Bryobacteraceae bacterium]